MPFDYAKQPGLVETPRQGNEDFEPLISVITPFYNAGQYFPQTFHSMVNQSFPWFEWIVVDDGSTSQKDLDVLHACAVKDARLRVVRQENGRVARARNRGVAESRTDIIVPLDADDLLEPAALECLYWALLSNPEAGWAYADSASFGGQHYLWRRDFSPQQELKENLLVVTAAIRKVVFEKIGGYRVEKGLYYEDWIFWVRALAAGFWPVHVQGYSFWYRRMGTGAFLGVQANFEAKKHADDMMQAEIDRCKLAGSMPVRQYPLAAGSQASAQANLNTPDWARYSVAETGPCTLLLTARLHGAESAARRIAGKGQRVVVASLYPEDSLSVQALQAQTADCFSLPAFLDVGHYPAFLQMLAQTRGVTEVLLDNVPEGLLFLGQGLWPDIPVRLYARDDVSLALAAPQLEGQGSLHAANLLKPALTGQQRALLEEVFLHYHAFFMSMLKNRAGGLFSTGTALAWPGDFAAGESLPDGGEPLVSIVVFPVKSAGCAVQLLRSLLAQTFPWYEILVLDVPGAKESAAAFWQALVRRETRIRPIEGNEETIVRQAKADFLLLPGESSLFGANYLEMVYWGLRGMPKASYARTSATDIGLPANDKPANDGGASVLVRKAALGDIPLRLDEITQGAILRLGLDRAGMPDGTEGPEDGLVSPYLPIKAEYWPIPLVPLRKKDGKNNADVPAQAGSKKSFFHYRLATGAGEGYVLPQKMEWNRGVYQKHGKIHLAVLLPWMEMGGADKFNLDLLAGLDKSRYQVSVLSTLYAKNTWMERFREITAEVYPMAEYVGFDNLASYLSYFIQSREVDILLVTNSFFGYQVLPWLRIQFPHLVLVDYVHMEEWNWRQGGFARASGDYGSALEKTYVCNGATRNVLLQHFGRVPDSVETVYIGTDAEYYAPGATLPGQVYQWLGINAARPIVLFACRLAAQKRPFLMLAIALFLKQRGSNAAFVVAGDGPLEKDMRDWVKQNALEDTVFFAGRISDLRPYYRDATLTLLCSFMEGLALTTYESMAMETPVVTSDVGGQAELADNETGRVLPLIMNQTEHYDLREYPVEEIVQYTDAIAELLANPDELLRRGKLCRRKVLNGFTIQNMVAHLDREFTRLMGPDAETLRRRQWENWTQMAPVAQEMLSLASELAYHECRPLHEGLALVELETLNAKAQQLSDCRQELHMIKTSFMYRCTSKIAAVLDKLRGTGR